MEKTEITAEQYETSTNLEAHIDLHARFSTNPYGWQRWVFDQLELPEKAHILEVGCGVGRFWRENLARLPAGWRVRLSDFSPGMLRRAHANLSVPDAGFAYIVVEATRLPSGEQEFDAIIANHMLYYVQDKARCFTKFRRLLKSGGRLYAATNGSGHLRELVELVADFDPGIAFVAPIISNFTLENGAELLENYFDQVEVRRYADALNVTDAGALVDYILSTSGIYHQPEERKAALAEFVRERFAALGGTMRISKDAGLIRAIR